MPFVGGPDTRKSKIAYGRHLGKIKNRDMSAAVRAILTKFTQFYHRDRSDR